MDLLITPAQGLTITCIFKYAGKDLEWACAPPPK